jgi:hypothetical protein
MEDSLAVVVDTEYNRCSCTEQLEKNPFQFATQSCSHSKTSLLWDNGRRNKVDVFGKISA